MAIRQINIVVVGEVVTLVNADIPSDIAEPIAIVADDTWRLQNGDRAAAYNVMYRHCGNYIKENNIQSAVVKSSALTMGSTKLSHLLSAEIRGVVIASAASLVSVRMISKAVISRTYGDRKVDEYLQDDAFWASKTIGGRLRKTSREAAMLLVAGRNS